MANNCKLQIANCKLKNAESRARRKPNVRLSPICNLHFAFCILQSFIFVLVLGKHVALAQETPAGPAPEKPAAKQKLLERKPFDLVVLTKVAGGTSLEVQTISLPQRPPASLPKTGMLKVRVLDRPTEDFEIGWGSVAQIKTFEQQLMDEGLRLSAAGQFDEAYDYFGKLRNEYPNTPGLENAISDYLQRNAIALYQAKQHDRALALLLSLYQRNPTYAGLPTALETIAGEIIQRYLREASLASLMLRGGRDWRSQLNRRQA
jgi:tetratricopeptide (TPR) repeat protein